MKKLMGVIGLLILVGTGVILVRSECQSIDLLCDVAFIWCAEDCAGDFSLGNCWEYGQHTYCHFTCDYTGFCVHWSSDPVYGTCTLN
jgi:hypothetical protein